MRIGLIRIRYWKYLKETPFYGCLTYNFSFVCSSVEISEEITLLRSSLFVFAHNLCLCVSLSLSFLRFRFRLIFSFGIVFTLGAVKSIVQSSNHPLYRLLNSSKQPNLNRWSDLNIRFLLFLHNVFMLFFLSFKLRWNTVLGGGGVYECTLQYALVRWFFFLFTSRYFSHRNIVLCSHSGLCVSNRIECIRYVSIFVYISLIHSHSEWVAMRYTLDRVWQAAIATN